MKDQNGKDFKLSEQAGKRVLLSFHPLAWTSVCAEQMKSLDEQEELRRSEYSCSGLEEEFSQRANVLIDENGKVAFVKVYELKQLPPTDEVIEVKINWAKSNPRDEFS